VLGAALGEGGRPAHAYLLHGPAGTGKRAAARAFAAELLSQGARDPANARTRTEHGTHPDLTWVTPSGAHEMLRRDVEEAIVGAAGHTPFEARWRVFVIERADTMNDEAANSLLKTLEEPPHYVVLLLLTDRPSQVMPTIASRCQGVRFDALSDAARAERLQSRGVPAEAALACARLSLGDGERALALALGDGPAMRAGAEAVARGALRGDSAARPWMTLIAQARAAGASATDAVEAALENELGFAISKDHGRLRREAGERAKRAARRAQTAALDRGLALVGLWLRDVACIVDRAPELVHHSDRLAELGEDAARGVSATALREGQTLVDETRASFELNPNEELALDALGLRLARTLTDRRAATAQT
jgi:DNA polymerase-3 subunit delta'